MIKDTARLVHGNVKQIVSHRRKCARKVAGMQMHETTKTVENMNDDECLP